MAYRYVAYNPAGQRVQGVLEVDTAEAAEAVLFQADLTVVKLGRAFRLPRLQELFPALFRPKAADLIALTRQLVTLLEAGIPLRTALQLLQEQVANPMLKEALADIIRQLEVGSFFSTAIASHPLVFPAFYQRLATVGEETGHLEPLLRQAADYMERDAAIVSRVRRALIYPAIVMSVGIAATFVLLTWTVPALSRLFAEFEATLPLTTRLLMGLGDLASRYGRFFMLAVLALVILGFRYLRTPSGARRRDYFLNQMPVVAKVIRASNMARLCFTLTTLIRAGLPLGQVMDILIKSLSHAPVRESLEKVRADLLIGERLGQALGKHKVYPRLLVQLVVTGEETGALAANLEASARFYEEDTNRAITGVTTFLEPALVLLIGAAIGFVAISVITPMYSIIQQIR